MANRLDSEESIRRWDEYAADFTCDFTEQGDINREVLLNPALFELLGPVEGKRVLDDGCGEGYLSRLLAKRGASVVGIDYSREMLRLARERTPDDMGIEYHYANAEKLDLFDDGSFDAVVSNLVLIDLERYEDAIAEAYRVLVPDGLFVLAISHPCFGAPNNCGWVRDESGERLFWKVDRYFYEGPYEERIRPKFPNTLIQFHRTLTSYVRALLGAGFAIEDLLEAKPSAEIVARHPEFVNDLRMCHFILFKLRKSAQPTRGGDAR